MPHKRLWIKRLIRAGKSLYDRGFLMATDGNLSVRPDRDTIIITASGICKGTLLPDNIVIMTPSGKIIDGLGKPSSETEMHLHIYHLS